MTTENRRKEVNEAKTGDSGQNPVQLTNGVMVDKAEKEKSILPDHQQYTLPLEIRYIPKIRGVVSDDNILTATEIVIRNKGAPGVDGITIEQIKDYMKEHWPKIKQDILEGKYRPKPVRRVEIPKPDGSGVRKLGIPTVVDRIIQQAIYQEIVLTFDSAFSDNSYGFRKGRRAQHAVYKAQKYIQEGYTWVVDIDLEKFFDKVNHDILMSRVAKRVQDKKILLLIRRFLQAGVMEDGIIQATEEGTPQGGPLSPLLSNIMLDDFDKELEKRGLRFARYADDCNIYVKSEKAAKRVIASVTRFLTTKLKLKVNEQKSAVARPWERKFLGFTFTQGKDSGQITIHESRVRKLKDKIRGLTKKMRGMNITDSIRKLIMPTTRGWANYFSIAETLRIFTNLDGWIRRKIRSILWRQWKKPRTRRKKLIELGIKDSTARKHAYSSKGPWKMSRCYCIHKALSNQAIENLGYTPMITIVCARLQCS